MKVMPESMILMILVFFIKHTFTNYLRRLSRLVMINIPPRNIFSLKDAFTKCYHIINKSLWAATTLSGLKKLSKSSP